MRTSATKMITLKCDHTDCTWTTTRPTEAEARNSIARHKGRAHAAIPRGQPRPWIAHCPVCQHASQAIDKGQANWGLKTHVATQHPEYHGPIPLESPNPAYKPLTKPTEPLTVTRPEQPRVTHDEAVAQGKRLIAIKAKAHRYATDTRRVYWDRLEMEQIITRAAELRFEDIQVPLLHLAQQAQEVLPSNRHRVINTLCALPNDFATLVKVKFDSILKAKIDAARVPPETKIQVVTVPVEIVREPDPGHVLRHTATNVVLAEAIGRILEHFPARDNRHHNGNGTPPSVPPPRPARLDPTPPITSNRTTPRIAVVGLLKDQFEHVRQKVQGQAVELLFIDKEQSNTRIPNVDALICERHIDHRWTENGKAALGNDRVLWAEGVTTTVQRIYDYLSRKPQTQTQHP